MAFGWTCRICTYEHAAPSHRCVMCGELRVSKQQMRDFVRGIPIPTSQPATTIPSVQRPTAPTTADPTESDISRIAVSRKAVTNPYGTAKGRSSAQSTATSSMTAAHASNMVPPSATTAVAVHPARPLSTANSKDHRDTGPSRQAALHLQQPTDAPPPKNGPPAPPLVNSYNHQRPKPAPHTASNKFHKQAASFLTTASAAPKVSTALPTYQPGPVPYDPATIVDWIYPAHETFPTRQYQLEMTHTALFHNTLISLPTGLGKTHIASVVLYNFYRWFPTGKVLFLAPTLPLVNQQVKACYEIMGIPTHITAVLTGKTLPDRRTEIWNQKQAFFCTPQTVQRDLEGGRCPAQQVVCVVLDEAHKACGEYAYVKVVEYLEIAGAHFRVVGLSATPGANIQAIQQVVDALRITKIDARGDADPTVAPYTHERHSEILIVKQASAARDIEHALNAIIGPLLDRLRSGGALTRISGNATVTSYNILKAREEMTRNGGGGSNGGPMSGYLIAAHAFVHCRDLLHKHGVGMVRMKVAQLRNDPQREYMATIVKDVGFQRLWEAVMSVTSDPNSKQATVQDSLAHNPKLTKLREILIEHFERARACNTSSRAIVFSQFRDSVSEIVSVLKALEPLIRPRHFIGQGKGGKSDAASGKLKGMKQAEQQQVIREFIHGVFNVLVCTCIGEEGLDIGEVDLIINFDTLRNPIRMIQRVGRTGRKREGRVVCLVSEGQEERTLKASKQSERNLMHALKNPKSFRCRPTIPLLPGAPARRDSKMVMSQNFHISQVEGCRRVEEEAENPAGNNSRWRLNGLERGVRSRVLGQLTNIHVERTDVGLPPVLVRKFFGARGPVLEMSKFQVGRTVDILRRFESAHPTYARDRRTRTSRLEGREISILFPSGPSPVYDEPLGLCQYVDMAPSALAAPKLSEKPKSPSAVDNVQVSSRSHEIVGIPAEANGPVAAWETLGVLGSQQALDLCVKIGQRRLKGFAVPGDDADAGKCCGQSSSSNAEIVPREEAHGSGYRVNAPVKQATECNLKEIDALPDDFFLLTQSDSDSSVCHEDDSVDSKVGGDKTRNRRRPSSAGLTKGPIESFTAIGDEFRLPTQESSSSSDDESSCTDAAPGGAPDQGAYSVQVPSAVAVPFDGVGIGTAGVSQGRKVRFSLVQSPSFLVGSAPKELDPADRGHKNGSCPSSTESDFPVKRMRRHVLAIEDTPDSGKPVLGSIRNGSSNYSVDVGLVDTQSPRNYTADDIVCAVCKSGSMASEDPIILCDGDGRTPCNLAVHLSCYNLDKVVLAVDEWRCDPCRFRFAGGKAMITCSSCNQSHGVLKELQAGQWRHVVCGDRKRLKRLKEATSSAVKHAPKRKPRRQLALRRTLNVKRKRFEHGGFVDDEAGIDSDEDIDGDDEEDDEIEAIENEEELAAGSFINDSSQLGYTQDRLDDVDPDLHDDTAHRAFDAAQQRLMEFATPVLNRRLKHRQARDRWSESPASGLGSQRGLGGMHFIRSVLEHHRQGGRAEEIEELYLQLEREAGHVDEGNLRPQVPAPVRMEIEYRPGDESD